MKFACITIFPDLFDGFLRIGLMGKACERGLVTVQTLSPRAFAPGPHHSVDDAPYGGGAGMVMMAPPLLEAIERVEREDTSTHWRRILLTPRGTRMTQQHAQRWSLMQGLILIAGRYEGIDERVHRSVHEEISIGDYVMMGGEVASMVIMESVTRLLPGVLGNPHSTVDESHVEQGWAEYPQYTRPPEYRGQRVPEVLLSGNHEAIAAWRKSQSRHLMSDIPSDASGCKDSKIK